MKKLIGRSRKKKGKQKGFTLIELVLYMGILSILVGVLSAIFGSILDVQLESQATAGVDQDGRYVLQKLSYDMKTSSEVLIPDDPGDSSATLQIRVNSINYTYSLDTSNNLIITNNSTSEVNRLNGSDTQITGLNFQKIGSGDTSDTVRVNFAVVSRVQQTQGQESRIFQTTLARQ